MSTKSDLFLGKKIAGVTMASADSSQYAVTSVHLKFTDGTHVNIIAQDCGNCDRGAPVSFKVIGGK